MVQAARLIKYHLPTDLGELIMATLAKALENLAIEAPVEKSITLKVMSTSSRVSVIESTVYQSVHALILAYYDSENTRLILPDKNTTAFNLNGKFSAKLELSREVGTICKPNGSATALSNGTNIIWVQEKPQSETDEVVKLLSAFNKGEDGKPCRYMVTGNFELQVQQNGPAYQSQKGDETFYTFFFRPEGSGSMKIEPAKAVQDTIQMAWGDFVLLLKGAEE